MLTGTCHCRATSWRVDAAPDAATACNCTVCRRYGVLWIYGWEGVDVHVTGTTTAYVRKDGGALEFHFCPTCGNTVCWRRTAPGKDGRRRCAVNIRLADDPDSVMDLPLEHFDGFGTFQDLEQDGRKVRDLWF